MTLGHDPDRVHQACGMVSVQADCTMGEALALMETNAEETGRSLLEVATAVVHRRLRFD